VYSLSHFDLPVGVVIHFNSLKKFSTSTLGALVTIQTYPCLGEISRTKYVRLILCAVQYAD
jgi:hypothetical protein